MNTQRETKQIQVMQVLRKLSEAVPALSDSQLDKFLKNVKLLSCLPPDCKMMPIEERNCRYGDKCKNTYCSFSHSQEDGKKQSVNQLLKEMKDKAKHLRQFHAVRLLKSDKVTQDAERKKERVQEEAKRKEDIAQEEAKRKEERAQEEAKRKEERAQEEAKRKEDRVQDTLRNVRCAFNKVTWSNYDTLLAQVASLVDSLYMDGLLNTTVSSEIFTMMTDHTIYVEAYGKMWSTLAEVYPCLLPAGQKVLDTYLEYYDQFRGEECEVATADKQLDNCIKKRQRIALTSFLVHSMKFSNVSLEREEVTEKMHYMVSRLNILLEKGECNGGEFGSLIDDMVVLLREGWEVLCREDVWPLCIQQMEKTIAYFTDRRQQPRGQGEQDVKLRILFVLEDVMRDIVEQGRYYSC